MTFRIPEMTDRLYQQVWLVKVTMSRQRPPTPDTYEDVYLWLQAYDDWGNETQQENRIKLKAAQMVAANPRVTHVIKAEILRVEL